MPGTRLVNTRSDRLLPFRKWRSPCDRSKGSDPLSAALFEPVRCQLGWLQGSAFPTQEPQKFACCGATN